MPWYMRVIVVIAGINLLALILFLIPIGKHALVTRREKRRRARLERRFPPADLIMDYLDAWVYVQKAKDRMRAK